MAITRVFRNGRLASEISPASLIEYRILRGLLFKAPTLTLHRSNRAAAGDKVDDENDDRNHEEQVDEAACDVQAEAEEPEDNKDYEDCPEHGGIPFDMEHTEGRWSIRVFAFHH
jgi:hypothetical protein